MWYLSNVLELPENSAKEIDKMIFIYFWNYRKHFISKEQIILNKIFNSAQQKESRNTEMTYQMSIRGKKLVLNLVSFLR